MIPYQALCAAPRPSVPRTSRKTLYQVTMGLCPKKSLTLDPYGSNFRCRPANAGPRRIVPWRTGLLQRNKMIKDPLVRSSRRFTKSKDNAQSAEVYVGLFALVSRTCEGLHTEICNAETVPFDPEQLSRDSTVALVRACSGSAKTDSYEILFPTVGDIWKTPSNSAHVDSAYDNAGGCDRSFSLSASEETVGQKKLYLARFLSLFARTVAGSMVLEFGSSTLSLACMGASRTAWDGKAENVSD
ncbi:hypothetical protein BV898_19708 [Hypsibius exemplaris]|uniref:Uncharacterized protein n=1 Tax=Hypsibius exemplaris TaxID=2072580 RepID=A0A9X6RP83_HYPEX|nr:hypothetical protein BV898_19708 [Hypsibius exemplaris]